MVATTTYVASKRRPSAWIDTCVILEIFSHGDLWAAYERPDQALTIEDRRLLMRGSLWLAMALVRQQAMTIHYHRETLRNILRLASPDSDSGTWVSTIVHDLGPFLFSGWERQTTWHGEVESKGGIERETSDRERDRQIVAMCRDERWVLVTRDGIRRNAAWRKEGLFHRARGAGIDVKQPEEYAGEVLGLEDARVQFNERLHDALSRYETSGPPNGLDERTIKVRNIRDGYEAIWQGS